MNMSAIVLVSMGKVASLINRPMDSRSLQTERSLVETSMKNGDYKKSFVVPDYLEKG